MKNRWILSLFVLVFVISNCIFAFADENVSKDDAKKIAVDTVEKYFDIEVEDDFSVEAEEAYEEGAWDVNIFREDKNYLDIDVYIEADKTVSSIYIYTDDENNKKITKDEARKLADNIVNKMHPDKVKNTKCIQTENENSFDFKYKRISNKLEFAHEGIDITVDKETCKVSDYYLDWSNDIDIPVVEDIIDKDKARKIIEDNLEMKPIYIDSYDKDGNEKVKLVYEPSYKISNMVNAKSGELEDYIKNIDKNMISKENYKQSISVKMPSYNLTEQEAKDIAIKKMKELSNKDINIKSIEELGDNNKKKTAKGEAWGVKFTYKDEEKNELEGKLVIDKNNKEIIHMRTDFDKWKEASEKLKYTWEDGYEKALEVIKNNCQSKAINIDTGKREINEYYDEVEQYSFDRVVNGVVYDEDRINVYVDLNNNTVLAIESEWDNSKVFEDKNKALNKEKLKQSYLDKNEVKLCYVTILDQKNNKKSIRLMYRMSEKEGIENIGYIDALTGEFLDYGGEVINMK